MPEKLLQVIADRRSVRKYKDEPLSEEQIEALVKAALISPSSRNQQPWHLSVITNPDIIRDWEADIVQHYLDVNIEWIVKINAARGNKIFYDVPAVFLITMKEGSELDVGIMAQSLALAAKSMGLDSVILGFPRVAFLDVFEGKWSSKLGVPDGYVYGISVAIGYGDEPPRSRNIDRNKLTYIK